MANELKKQIVETFESIKQCRPLIHHITNYVVMNLTANATLHIGASPVMAHAVEEVEQMVAMSKALVVNVGTLSKRWIEAMFLAGQTANKNDIPIILDPVGMGATEFRTQTIMKLIDSIHPTIIKGNSGEIGQLHGEKSVKVSGVDATRGVDDPIKTVRDLARKFQGRTVVALSDKTDYVSDGKRIVSIDNGSARRGVTTGGRVGRVNPPAFENFVFFAQKDEKNCAFESILVTNPSERTCYAPPASRS